MDDKPGWEWQEDSERRMFEEMEKSWVMIFETRLRNIVLLSKRGRQKITHGGKNQKQDSKELGGF